MRFCLALVMLIVVPGAFSAPGTSGSLRYRAIDLREFGIATANALNQRGEVVGTTSSGKQLIIANPAAKMVRSVFFSEIVLPAAICKSGTVAGTLLTDKGETILFHMVGDEVTRIDAPPGHDTLVVRGINTKRQLLVQGFGGPSGTKAYVIDNEVRDLGHLGGRQTIAYAINERGGVAGMSSVEEFTPPRAFLYDRGEMQGLGRLSVNAGGSVAHGLNDQNMVVGSSNVAESGTRHAFIYSAGRMVDLDPEFAGGGSSRSEAIAVNNFGLVVGDSLGGTVWIGGRKRRLLDQVVDNGSLIAIGEVKGVNDRGQILAEAMDQQFTLFPVLLAPLEGSYSSAQLVNLSARASAGRGSETTITGFVIGGKGSGKVLLRSVGPTLKQFGVDGVADDPAIELFNRDGQEIASNQRWGAVDNVELVASTARRVGAFPLDASSSDAAMLIELAPGPYTAHTTAEGRTGRIVLTEMYDAGGGGDIKLVNASIRMRVGQGEQIGICGFHITGQDTAYLLLRAIGPHLEEFGITDYLPDPVIWLYDGAKRVMGNESWGSDADTPLLAGVIDKVGAFRLSNGSRDAALLVALEPGTYTIHISDSQGRGGVVLAEAYALPREFVVEVISSLRSPD